MHTPILILFISIIDNDMSVTELQPILLQYYT